VSACRYRSYDGIHSVYRTIYRMIGSGACRIHQFLNIWSFDRNRRRILAAAIGE